MSLTSAMPAAEALRLGALNSIHALRWLRHAVVTVWAWLWGSVLYLTKHKGSKLELIQRDVQELQKLPVHLALLVNERQISHSDLARLVNWCFCAGINYVSLYDPRGQHRYVLVFHIQFSYMHVRMTSSQDCRSVCFSHNIIVCACACACACVWVHNGDDHKQQTMFWEFLPVHEERNINFLYNYI